MILAGWQADGFEIQTINHAHAVLVKDFPEPLQELDAALREISISDDELVQGGGGEAGPTQRLRRALTASGWRKENIVIRKIVDGEERAAITHEIDHVRRDTRGTIALEIEWNNKDPFFDRDLENFHRLHSEGVISVGAIVTRGESLQDSLVPIVRAWAQTRNVSDFDDLARFDVVPTARQRKDVQRVEGDLADRWARMFVREKFGSSTTHWAKLQERIARGVGSPCPLLLIGIPVSVIFKEAP